MGGRRRPSGNSELTAATGRDKANATHVSICLPACAYTRRMPSDSLIDSQWWGFGQGDVGARGLGLRRGGGGGWATANSSSNSNNRQLTYYVRMGGVCARRVTAAARVVEEELDTLRGRGHDGPFLLLGGDYT